MDARDLLIRTSSHAIITINLQEYIHILHIKILYDFEYFWAIKILLMNLSNFIIVVYTHYGIEQYFHCLLSFRKPYSTSIKSESVTHSPSLSEKNIRNDSINFRLITNFISCFQNCLCLQCNIKRILSAALLAIILDMPKPNMNETII